MSWSFRSPAKINPHLRVLGRRSDGFHELRLLFQTIDLHDRLDFAPRGGGFTLEVVAGRDGPELAAGDDNLVLRAARAFGARWPFRGGLAIRLHKVIPWAAGLGGGSSNAATTLLALREITGQPAEVSALWEMASALGADVPFFLLGGLAAGFGRGDELFALEEAASEELVLAVPNEAMPTAAAFAAMAPVLAARAGAPEPWPAVLRRWALDGRQGESLRRLAGTNDLQAVVFERSSVVSAVYAALHRQGVEGVCMSGSGACLFGFASAGSALPELPPELGSVLSVRTLPRGELAGFRRLG